MQQWPKKSALGQSASDWLYSMVERLELLASAEAGTRSHKRPRV
jgi:hypothetical protein